MTATDELRRMLDGCGVEWWNGHGDCDGHAGTLWDGIGGRWYAGGMTGTCGCRLYLETPADRTPEQAIAATLGKGTCRNVHEPPRNTTFWPTPHFKCSKCGATYVSTTYAYYCPSCGRKVMDE